MCLFLSFWSHVSFFFFFSILSQISDDDLIVLSLLSPLGWLEECVLHWSTCWILAIKGSCWPCWTCCCLARSCWIHKELAVLQWPVNSYGVCLFVNLFVLVCLSVCFLMSSAETGSSTVGPHDHIRSSTKDLYIKHYNDLTILESQYYQLQQLASTYSLSREFWVPSCLEEVLKAGMSLSVHFFLLRTVLTCSRLCTACGLKIWQLLKISYWYLQDAKVNSKQAITNQQASSILVVHCRRLGAWWAERCTLAWSPAVFKLHCQTAGRVSTV
jgi:hypothetical protein